MDKRPKITVLVHKFPNIVQTYIVNHVTGLIDQGVTTSILAEENPGQSETNPSIDDYNLLKRTLYSENNINALREFSFRPANLLNILRLALSKIWFRFSPMYLMKSVVRTSAITKSDCSLIHAHSLFSAYNFLFSRVYLGVPMVVTYHGKEPRGANNLPKDKTAAIIQYADSFVVNTTFARDEMLELGCPSNKIEIVPQGTDIEHFRFDTHRVSTGETIRLLTVARLSPEKGHETAIRALASLVKEQPMLEYHIVGQGPQRERIIQLSVKLGIKNHVILHDYMTGSDLLDMFRQAHIFILPSIDFHDGYLVETQGVVLQEAQACGVPVIGSDAGGIPDVIFNGETGLIFKQRDHKQLAAHILSLINDALLYRKLSEAGRRDTEQNYSIEVVCKQLVALYESLIGTSIVHTRTDDTSIPENDEPPLPIRER